MSIAMHAARLTASSWVGEGPSAESLSTGNVCDLAVASNRSSCDQTSSAMGGAGVTSAMMRAAAAAPTMIATIAYRATDCSMCRCCGFGTRNEETANHKTGSTTSA